MHDRGMPKKSKPHREALEAKELANDKFFYEKLATPMVDKELRDDVELIDPNPLPPQSTPSTLDNVNGDVEFVQDRRRSKDSNSKLYEFEWPFSEFENAELNENDKEFDEEERVFTGQQTNFDGLFEKVKQAFNTNNENKNNKKRDNVNHHYWKIEYEQ